jgi:phospholipid N-methyltransferase
MKRTLDEYRLFLQEFRQTFRTTGAILPSGRSLAKALARNVGKGDVPLRILEVGPGTGAVTAQIVKRMKPGDRLELVELNDRFVDRLHERFSEEPDFHRVEGQTQIHHAPLQEVNCEQPFDVVISGLPLNNFAVHEVEGLLKSLVGSVRTGGTLSFFEYVAVRYAKAAISKADDRVRLRGISKALNALFAEYPTERQWVWPNVPPAWVHHVRVQRAAT